MGVLLHEDDFGHFTFTLNPALIVANDTVLQSFPIKNLRVGDMVFISAPNMDTTKTVIFTDAFCKTPGVLTIRFVNYAAGSVDLTGTNFHAFVYRAERTRNAIVDA